MIRDVLLDGIADVDIRREALSVDGMQAKSINDIVSFVETRETARDAHVSHNVSALSSYRKKQKLPEKQNVSPTSVEKEATSNCPDCGKKFLLFYQEILGVE